ncbi:hypothetical protein D3C71_2105310 [compost metagenome]
MNRAAITSIAKAKPETTLCEANVDSMMASFEKKPAVPITVPGIPTPVSAIVPMNIVQ